jgi:hypothetical protein
LLIWCNKELLLITLFKINIRIRLVCEVWCVLNRHVNEILTKCKLCCSIRFYWSSDFSLNPVLNKVLTVQFDIKLDNFLFILNMSY